MKLSTDRILTTHVGSLPRSQAVCDAVFAKDRGDAVDPQHFERTIATAVHDVVKRQVDTGIDVVSDGEMSKISYATYIKERISGFEGDSPRRAPADLQAYPGYLEKIAKSGGTPAYTRPVCKGEIRLKDRQPVQTDIGNFESALAATPATEAFLNAASPGVIALFQPNEYYASGDDYLQALADAMREEYEAIVAAGFLLQLDCPDIGLGRHMMYKDLPERDYLKRAERHIEALNESLRNIAPERLRMHICWGNYEGPHHCDIEMEKVLPLVMKAKPQALLFESANPRHAHEWQAFSEYKIPDDKILIPGMIDSTTNFIEHPRLIAERICRFADIVGRERVLAGSDCGFATFAGFGAVDAEIAYGKLAALVEGARIASERLWG
jgi:5-methyltetrahydropteroyltriglutamate--homocysteine methyltransferase